MYQVSGIVEGGTRTIDYFALPHGDVTGQGGDLTSTGACSILNLRGMFTTLALSTEKNMKHVDLLLKLANTNDIWWRITVVQL
jgi:hypothetical protein